MKDKAFKWIGIVISFLVVVMMLFSATLKLAKPDEVVKGFVDQFGYPESQLVIIGILEIVCALVYAFPKTAVLGAVLLTGYLGGAVATHTRVQDPMLLSAVIMGIFVWLGLWFRDARIRALLPLR